MYFETKLETVNKALANDNRDRIGYLYRLQNKSCFITFDFANYNSNIFSYLPFSTIHELDMKFVFHDFYSHNLLIIYNSFEYIT